MAKFLKSIFTPDRRKSSRFEGESEEDKNDFTPPLDGRRKLSISRSGRMKQANKKRHSLSMELYGDDLHHTEKPKSLEYHVNNPNIGSEPNSEKRRSSESKHSERRAETPTSDQGHVKTPEEEIESAFEIIDKIS